MNNNDKVVVSAIIMVIFFVIGLVAGIFIGQYSSSNEGLIEIKVTGLWEEYGSDREQFMESIFICNLNTGNCGNDLYYEKGKGFYWLAFGGENGSTIINAEVVKPSQLQDGEVEE